MGANQADADPLRFWKFLSNWGLHDSRSMRALHGLGMRGPAAGRASSTKLVHGLRVMNGKGR